MLNSKNRARGGKRPGAGRKTEDFKTALGKAIEENDILGNVIKMATGEIEVSDKVRLSASLWLLEMKNGKAAQAVEHSGNVATSYKIIFENVHE